MVLRIQDCVSEAPGASDSTYWVRCGDQSSGSTTSPSESRLMMFIATMRGAVASPAWFVTVVWNSTLSPFFVAAEVLLMEICRPSACDCACADSNALAEIVLRESK